MATGFKTDNDVTDTLIINCVSYGASTNYEGSFDCINCVAGKHDSTDDDYDVSGAGCENNVSMYGLAPGTSPLSNKPATSIKFVDVFVADFHVATSSICITSGSNQSAYFTTDIDGNTIVNWMRGVDWNNGSGYTDLIYNVGVITPYDFATINLAISAIPEDLSLFGGGIREICIESDTYDETVYLRDVNFDDIGFDNASDTNNITIRAMDGSEHNGDFTAGVIIKQLKVSLNYTEVKNIVVIDSTDPVLKIAGENGFTTDDVILENVLVKATTDTDGILLDYTDNAKLRKCAVWTTSTSTKSGIKGGSQSNSTNSKYYNCIAHNFKNNFNGGQPINSVALINNSGYDFVNYEGTPSNNCSGDATAPGSNSLINKDNDDVGFLDIDNGNFHVYCGELEEDIRSILLTAGTDVSTEFTTDVDNEEIYIPMIGFDYEPRTFFITGDIIGKALISAVLYSNLHITIYPESGYVGDNIEITATSRTFTSPASTNTVIFTGYFGDVEATIVSGTSTSLIVTIPENVIKGDVSVTNGDDVESNAVTFTPLLAISLSAYSGKIGDLIEIEATSGFFSKPYNKNVVTFNGVIATIIRGETSPPNLLTVTVPILSSTGVVKVETFVEDLNAISDTFTVLYDDETFFDNEIAKPPFYKGSINGNIKTSGIGSMGVTLYNKDVSYSNFIEVLDENSMIQNLFSIILTGKNERIWEPTMGSNVKNIVFKLMDDPKKMEIALLNEIDEQIRRYEPRLILIKSSSWVTIEPDNNKVIAVLAIKIPSGVIKEIGITLGQIKNENN